MTHKNKETLGKLTESLLLCIGTSQSKSLKLQNIMGRFINPFTDMGFKRIFGQEASKDLLIEFLNDLLVGEKQIKDIRFLDKELIPEYGDGRGIIYDVYCTTEEGEHFIVEMQNKSQIHFKERALFYLSSAIARQGVKGSEWMFDIKAVYGVFFMNFTLKETPQKLKTDVMLLDRETHETFSDKLRFIFIELPCFNKAEDECENDFERWIYVLKNMEILDRMPFTAYKAAFEKLEKITDIAALSKEDRMKYDESIKVYRDIKATLAYSKEEGRKEGRAEGAKIKSLQIATNLKKLGMKKEDIIQATGLSIEEIQNLE